MLAPVNTLNEAYSSLAARRRYEVWFLRLGLADGAGAWWFRYLLMNPGRNGCTGTSNGAPVQVWATWFDPHSKPQSFIQSFSLGELQLSPKGRSPFQFRAAENEIAHSSCRGHLQVEGHDVAWDLHYSSSFGCTLSNKGWIGFSRTPHSDAIFSGHISYDGRTFKGQPLGFGLQGHNCGYRHRNFWRWAHAFFPRPGRPPSTLEALTYEMPLGLVFRKCVLWHEGRPHVFGNLQESAHDPRNPQWNFRCCGKNGVQVEAAVDGRGPGVHRLPYVTTDCSGTFEVLNNSLASAVVRVRDAEGRIEELQCRGGAVLEFGGRAAASSQ